MPQDLLFPFIILALLSELTPGPNMGFLAIVSARLGARAGLATVAGVTAGLVALLLIAVGAFFEVITIAPWAYEVLRWAGAGYLLWLAVELWRGDFEASATRLANLPVGSRLALRGFTANLLNPKAAAFYLVVLPGFTDAQAGPVAQQALVLGAIHIAVSVVVHVSIVLAASGVHPLLRAASLERGRALMRRLLAVAMVAIALWLLWETRAGALAP